MKKLAALASVSAYFLSASVAFAQLTGPNNSVRVGVGQPALGINPAAGVGTVLTNALTIIFVVAALAVLFYLIWGAFDWITSGGDKEKVGAARKKIVNALVGLAILALAFLIVVVVGQILNIDILNIDVIPALDSCPGNKLDPNTGQCIPLNQTPSR